MNGNWTLFIWFYLTLSPSSFPCLLLKVELWQLSGINQIRKKSLRYVYLQVSLYYFLPLFSVQTTGNYFLLLFSVTVYFFSTSFTINASECHAGCFRYHTESTEFSKARVANTQCRKKITKYDFFGDKLCSHCEMNELLSSLQIKYFTLRASPQHFSAWFRI